MDALPFQSPGPLSTAVFLAVVAFVAGSGVAAAVVSRRRLGAAEAQGPSVSRRAGLVVFGWLFLTAALPASGVLFLSQAGLLVMVAGSLIAALALGFSTEGGRWARGLPLWALIGFHGFRLPLEWVLHRWHAEGTVPIQMTWNGANLDVFTGVICALAGTWLWFREDRAVAWVASVVGLGLLLNVMRVAMLSSPLPLPGSYGADPPLLLGLYAPYAWIVSICVAGALVGHIVGLRKLLGR